jgi:two-component system, OmpR family, sensor histidine kinase KdpD
MILVAGSLVVVTALIALDDAGAASVLRHAYFLPVIMAALRFGAPGGTLAAGAAVLLDAPFVLPEIERSGLTAPALEGLVTVVMLALVGTLSGALKTRAARHRRRYELLATLQRTLADEVTLDVALARLRSALADRLGVDALILAARADTGLVIVGGERVASGALIARVLDTGASELVRIGGSDAGGRGVLSRRAFATPLVAGGQAIGVLAVERKGEIPAEERAALEALGAQMGLALENARLASRQRHFAAELADKVSAARRELEELDRAKSAFVAIASHELRTPLTALQGFSELLAVRHLPPDEVKRLGAIMRREARRLGRIVSDLLDLSRIERGLDPALCRIPLAVEPTVVATVDLFRQGTTTHPIAIACEPALPKIDADPDAIERVLTNLISNAIKYSPAGSVIRVGARAVDDGVAISVSDSGRGIPAEALGRIFEPYYRVPDAAGAARGTGIGLAVVKALVEAHGGAVEVESAPTLGTRVTVVLPAAQGPFLDTLSQPRVG